MTAIQTGIEIFLGPVAMAVLLVYVYGIISRASGPTWFRGIAVGALLGGASIYSMLNPLILSEGFIVDLRNLFVGLAAAFFGWPAGLVALVISAVFRIALAGDGAVFGVMAMAVAMVMGLLWRRHVNLQSRQQHLELAGLGLAISAHLLVGLLMPTEIRNAFFATLAPTLVACNIAGAYVIGRLIRREEMLIQETTRLSHAASTDPLTHLMNRRSAEEALAMLPQPRGVGIGRAMFYFDVDKFKDINDTHGHLVGDNVLLEITKRVQCCLRPNDLFARIGGDEFLVVLPEISPIDAEIVAERCRDSIARSSVNVADLALSLSISVGVKWQPRASRIADQVASADAALYKAKAGGRNRVVFDLEDAIPTAFNQLEPARRQAV